MRRTFPSRSLPTRVGLACFVACSVALPGLAQDRRAALERAVQDLPDTQTAPAAPATAPTLRLIDISLDAMVAAGTSTERDAVLQDLQGGGHDPRKRGFTVQNVELSLTGAVDPWFNAEAHLVTFLDPIEAETVVELEEAFLTSQALPVGLQLEVGQFFTEFGRQNPRHPHSWHFLDQPVIHTRVFGPDGMRGPGARLGWLLPTPFFAELHAGVQNANGETMASFLANDEFYAERPIGGRAFAEQEVSSFDDLVWLLRAETSFDLGAETSFGLGTSALLGPNATGGDGETLVYGLDFVWRWRPTDATRGWPFLTIEGEVIARRFDAAEQVDENDPLDAGDDVLIPGTTLDDWGFYAQVLHGFAPGWAAGVRGEWASGSGSSYDFESDAFARAADPFRADRLRISPLLAYHLSEYSRIRLQYNFDDSDALSDTAHSVWLGFEAAIGKHPAHEY